jgi:hypothetical protein
MRLPFSRRGRAFACLVPRRLCPSPFHCTWQPKVLLSLSVLDSVTELCARDAHRYQSPSLNNYSEETSTVQAQGNQRKKATGKGKLNAYSPSPPYHRPDTCSPASPFITDLIEIQFAFHFLFLAMHVSAPIQRDSLVNTRCVHRC